MLSLRKAAVVAAVVGSVSMAGIGFAVAQGEEESPLSFKCAQETGENTLVNQEASTVANVSDVGNGGDALLNARQQLCGLNNEGADNSGAQPAPTSTSTTAPPSGAAGGAGGILTGPPAAP